MDPLSELASVARPHMASRPLRRIDDPSPGDAVVWLAFTVGWFYFLVGVVLIVIGGMHLIKLYFEAGAPLGPGETVESRKMLLVVYGGLSGGIASAGFAAMWSAVVVWLLAFIYRRTSQLAR